SGVDPVRHGLYRGGGGTYLYAHRPNRHVRAGNRDRDYNPRIGWAEMGSIRAMSRRESRALLGALLLAGLLATWVGTASAASTQVPEGYQLVAENDVLEMYLNPETTQFVILDRRNGKLWYTNPPELRNIASALWQTHARSQLFFGYTDDKRRQIRETDPITEGARVTYEPIENGVRIIYTMPNRGFVITTDYV